MSKRAKNSTLRQVPAHRTVAIQLPLRMLEALQGAQNAFFGLCLAAGREVLTTMMEEDRTALCGPKGQQLEGRRAYRAGSAPSEVTLGGRRIPMRRLRARSVAGEELELPSFGAVADRDPLNAHTLASIASGVSTRTYADTLERLPAGEQERSISKSSVSRRFVALTQEQLTRWLSQPLASTPIVAILIDGKLIEDHAILIALGITEKGEKIVLGLREGSTENAEVVRSLLRDLIGRGLETDRRRLFVIDGGKGAHKAIRECFGSLALIQRCRVHKLRNVVEHLPDHLRASVTTALRAAWRCADAKLAAQKLERLARSLETAHHGAAASIREGLDETLTLQRLGLVEGALARTLATTNAIENLIGGAAKYARNVKRWRGGTMILRWVGAGVLHAQRRFRRLKGHRDLSRLNRALNPKNTLALGEDAA
jgi:putative transposase